MYAVAAGIYIHLALPPETNFRGVVGLCLTPLFGLLSNQWSTYQNGSKAASSVYTFKSRSRDPILKMTGWYFMSLLGPLLYGFLRKTKKGARLSSTVER